MYLYIPLVMYSYTYILQVTEVRNKNRLILALHQSYFPAFYKLPADGSVCAFELFSTYWMVVFENFTKYIAHYTMTTKLLHYKLYPWLQPYAFSRVCRNLLMDLLRLLIACSSLIPKNSILLVL